MAELEHGSNRVESVDSLAVEHDHQIDCVDCVCVGDVGTHLIILNNLIPPAETQDESDFLPQESLICCHCVRGGCTVLVAKKPTSEPHQRETGFRSVGQTTLHLFH